MNQIQVELQETMGTDKSIADSAWTSSLDYQKKQTRTEEDVKRVVNMLADLKHSVPFESVVLRFWMKIPIQTDRQVMTHRLQSASGMSGRYRTMPGEWLHVPEDIKMLTIKALGTLYNNDSIPYNVIQRYEVLCGEANREYLDIIKLLKQCETLDYINNSEFKRLREFYRGVLPQNNMTERVSIMNLRSFANFYKLRSDLNAQPEIQQVAKLMLEAVKQANICPIALEALERNHWSI